jgi:hypothetical protein
MKTKTSVASTLLLISILGCSPTQIIPEKQEYLSIRQTVPAEFKASEVAIIPGKYQCLNRDGESLGNDFQLNTDGTYIMQIDGSEGSYSYVQDTSINVTYITWETGGLVPWDTSFLAANGRISLKKTGGSYKEDSACNLY